jgi:hypothetical protein
MNPTALAERGLQMWRLLLVATLAIAATPPSTVFAVSLDIRVDAETMEAEKFSIKAVKLDDQRIEFTIIRRLDRPLYVVTSFELRKAGELVAETTGASGPTDGTQTWHLTLLKDHLSGSVFYYREEAYPHDGRFFRFGGTNYRFRLRDFPIADSPRNE